MSEMTIDECRDYLHKRYGQPRRIRDDIRGEVIVLAHDTQQSAQAYAAADTEHYGHPTTVQLREGVGWVHTIDLRPAIARIEAENGQ